MTATYITISAQRPSPASEPFGLVIAPEEWTKRALCQETDPEAFFAEKAGGSKYRDAEKVCAACPVIDECLGYALRNREQHGYWGGKSERQRARMLSERATR